MGGGDRQLQRTDEALLAELREALRVESDVPAEATARALRAFDAATGKRDSGNAERARVPDSPGSYQ